MRDSEAQDRATLRPDDVRSIARRAARRALAGHGLATDPTSGPGPAPGVHAAVVPPAPAAPPARRERIDRSVVTAACLAPVPDGAAFVVEPGARVTPLAEEEAARRGVRLVAGRAAQALGVGTLRVAVGSDHGGFALKSELLELLAELGHTGRDLGPATAAPCDYPDYAVAVAREVAAGRADVGVVVDGAGIGSAMAANKVPGALAANCWDERTARNARQHNHASVLTLGAGHLDLAAARAVLVAFLETPHGPGRHARRVEKIRAAEREYGRPLARTDTFDPTR